MRSNIIASLLVLTLTSAVFGSVVPGSSASIQNLKSKIKNVVVLVMENRSLDNLLGGQTIAGLDNIVNSGPYCNPLNLTNPAGGQVCSAPGDYDSVIDDPDHAIYGNNVRTLSIIAGLFLIWRQNRSNSSVILHRIVPLSAQR